MLSNLRMSPGEGIEAFADRLRAINARTYSTEGPAERVAERRVEADQRALDTFLRGLTGEVGHQCRLTAPETFDAAIGNAIRIQETERRPAEGLRDGPPARRVFHAPSQRVCFNCGQPGHLSKQCSRGRRCFICGGGDHLARDCRSRSGVQQAGDLNGAGAGRAAESGPW
ncbi:uncharacterized protein LOC124165019 [Ischnura elegans]|uniref:uncharacterized protein LOC124165019 n=1 Tax=Ischnura elegans TaxID=197161 RepID=UPI001ED8BC44|nr:uncharacterized protein LOC124165019 [Ischnura elegans]